MYIAYIGGYNPVIAFEDIPEKAMALALKQKRTMFPEECPKTWDKATEFYGGWVSECHSGLVVTEGL